MGWFSDIAGKASPLGWLGGGGIDDLTGKSDIDSANKANEKNISQVLGEIGEIGSTDESTLFGLIGALFGDAQGALASNTNKAQGMMGDLFSQGRDARTQSFDESIEALKAGYADAQSKIGAQTGAAVEASIASQRQALGQLGQNAISSGLGGTPTAAMARGIAGDSAQGMAGAFAQAGAQQGAMAAQQGESIAGQSAQYGGDIMQSFTQQAGAQGQTQLQLGQALAQLFQNQALQYGDLGNMRNSARLSVQHVPGASPLQQFGQAAGGIGSLFGALS